jgi:hypothetical protein
MKYKYFKKGDFIYIESADYLIEIDFSLYHLTEQVEFTVKVKVSISINWMLNAKELSFERFMTFYRKAKKKNPFIPDLFI